MGGQGTGPSGRRPGTSQPKAERGTSAALGTCPTNGPSPNGAKQAPIPSIPNLSFVPSQLTKLADAAYGDFYWQGGYGAFSVSEFNVVRVRTYIERQEEHHREITFQEEFRALCRKHAVQIDERYVWD